MQKGHERAVFARGLFLVDIFFLGVTQLEVTGHVNFTVSHSSTNVERVNSI